MSVPWGQTAHVYMNFDDSPSASQQSQYHGLINSLRQAAGQVFRDGTLSTQPNSTGIIRLSLHRNSTNSSVDFWITPYDLYLRGFTVFVNGQNITWQFASSSLREILQQNDSDWAAVRVNTFPFDVNYTNIENRAGTNRIDMQYNYNRFVTLYEVLRRAAWAGPGGDTAQAMLFFIQGLSESARFYDVYGVFSAIMASWSSDHIQARHVELENNWSPISAFAHAVT